MTYMPHYGYHQQCIASAAHPSLTVSHHIPYGWPCPSISPIQKPSADQSATSSTSPPSSKNIINPHHHPHHSSLIPQVIHSSCWVSSRWPSWPLPVSAARCHCSPLDASPGAAARAAERRRPCAWWSWAAPPALAKREPAPRKAKELS